MRKMKEFQTVIRKQNGDYIFVYGPLWSSNGNAFGVTVKKDGRNYEFNFRLDKDAAKLMNVSRRDEQYALFDGINYFELCARDEEEEFLRKTYRRFKRIADVRKNGDEIHLEFIDDIVDWFDFYGEDGE